MFSPLEVPEGVESYVRLSDHGLDHLGPNLPL